ncbi:competence protein TfoX [Aurantimonas aggregata]|uniref:Competence protein TfoX n=1 Tax=Aurantimonas aggregata TaxID=2047720 RepID=A0A6L9MM96_9HYPH|nr:TfoX/Sxy family protein [Aurantimonas aggregata]NDV88660.1 competence protein TfoX [Aurantimonas aggregata]
MDEAYLQDLFDTLSDLKIRRLFGGQGIYCGDRIVALVVGGVLHLKSDAESEPLYETAGLARWTYTRPGRVPTRMPYYRFPESALDDPEEAAQWTEIADAASRRAAAAPKPRSRRVRRALTDKASA